MELNRPLGGEGGENEPFSKIKSKRFTSKRFLSSVSPFSLQQQIVQYLKDMFDHDKVRFTSAQCLAEDILKLSHRRSDILLGYLGIDSLVELNGALPRHTDGSSGPN